MWTASLSQKTEVKQIGLDFPMLHRQSACCEAALWMTFDPRNLLIRMGQCVHMLLLMDPSIKQLLSFIYFFPPFLHRLDESKHLLPFTAAVFCGSSQFDSMKLWLFLLLTIQTPQPPHAALSASCRPPCVTHSTHLVLLCHHSVLMRKHVCRILV